MNTDAAAIAQEFAALATSDRRAILAALDRSERARLTVLCRRGNPAISRDIAESSRPPWFTTLVNNARDPRSDGPTHAARTALLDSLRTDDPPVRGVGRSLLQAAGGLLLGTRA